MRGGDAQPHRHADQGGGCESDAPASGQGGGIQGDAKERQEARLSGQGPQLCGQGAQGPEEAIRAGEPAVVILEEGGLGAPKSEGAPVSTAAASAELPEAPSGSKGAVAQRASETATGTGCVGLGSGCRDSCDRACKRVCAVDAEQQEVVPESVWWIRKDSEAVNFDRVKHVLQGHLPFNSSCDVCVRSRGLPKTARERPSEEIMQHEVQIDQSSCRSGLLCLCIPGRLRLVVLMAS